MLWYTVMHLECIIIVGLSFNLEAQTRRVMILSFVQLNSW